MQLCDDECKKDENEDESKHNLSFEKIAPSLSHRQKKRWGATPPVRLPKRTQLCFSSSSNVIIPQKGKQMLPIAGMLAEAGMSLLGSLLDVGEEKAKEFIEEKSGVKLSTKMSAEELEKLKEFEAKNLDMLLKKQAMFLQDRQNARSMNVDLSTNDNVPYLKKIYPEILSTIVVGASFFLFYMAYTMDLDNQKKDIVMMLIGMLNTAIGLILSFYFGSSTGSEEKTKIMSRR